MRIEVLGFLCRRATTQRDHNREQGSAIHATTLHRVGETGRPIYGRWHPAQDRALACSRLHFRVDSLQLESHEGRWRLHFDFDHAAWLRLLSHRLGRTVLLSNRMDWTAEQIVAGYSGQQQVEQGLPRFKGRRVAGLGTDASLDGHQNLRTCLLLHARHLASAIHP